MSVAEETIKEAVEAKEPIVQAKAKKSLAERSMDFISSVRFGVVLLCILVFLSMVGMLVMQQNVDGFTNYFAGLTPSEKMVGGFLGVFDIYHSWYYLGLLLLLCLNIILASIDHFPGAWSHVVNPKLTASRLWLSGQKNFTETKLYGTRDEIAAQVSEAMKKHGLKPRVSEKNDVVTVFGERGAWNRLGAYFVHVSLLTLFLGHFTALTTGFDADIQLMPGQTTNEIQIIRFNLDKIGRINAAMPFTLTCTDIEQKLIDPKGSIDINNTLDWRTQIKIDDPLYGAVTADVSLNKPYTYRGYRFFQASAITVGSARSMKIEMTPQDGRAPFTVDLQRNGTTTLEDGTKIEYDGFFADFIIGRDGQPDTRSENYNNPAVKLKVTPPNGEQKDGYAFAMKLPEGAPVGAPVAGYKLRLTEFAKSPLAHVLSIKYDPYNGHLIAWYFGGFGVMLALIAIYFFSHQRLWATIEEKGEQEFAVSLGGNANRNYQAFEDKVKKIVNQIRQNEQ